MNTRKSFRTMRIAGQLLLMSLVTVPALSTATVINILSEQLVVSLNALDESYTYIGSGFSAPGEYFISADTLLPNYNPYEPIPSHFYSMCWWTQSQHDNRFVFVGDANTDRSIGSGDYDPDTNVYTSSIVSFSMLFGVEGDGASLSTFAYSTEGNATLAIMDLTSGELYSGGELLSGHFHHELLSGHIYQVNAWARSVNGGGNEQLFNLDFKNAQASTRPRFHPIASDPKPFAGIESVSEPTITMASVPEPSVIVLLVTGLAGMGFAGGKRRQKELGEVIP